MPPLVSGTMVAVVGAALFRGLADTWREKWIALAIAAGAVTVIPFAVVMAGEEFVGEDVQPRYILPMLLVLLAVALLQRTDATADLFTRSQRILLAIAVPVAHSAALQVTIRRFVTGVDGATSTSIGGRSGGGRAGRALGSSGSSDRWRSPPSPPTSWWFADERAETPSTCDRRGRRLRPSRSGALGTAPAGLYCRRSWRVLTKLRACSS